MSRLFNEVGLPAPLGTPAAKPPDREWRSLYAERQPRTPKTCRPTPPPRALAAEEEQSLNSEHFQDQAPREVFATLLDAGQYVCSVATMYRILRENQEIRERRKQLRHPAYPKPVLVATGPNQVWTWDITKLPGPVKWAYFCLYVVLDLFSRFVVGSLRVVASRESAALAEQLIGETCAHQQIGREQLAVHSDRGAPTPALALRAHCPCAAAQRQCQGSALQV
jgi:putative transposase